MQIVLRHIGLFLEALVSAMSGTLEILIILGLVTMVVRVLSVLQGNTRALWALLPA